MITWERFCEIAEGLPEVTVGEHHDMSAIRFRTNVLATRPAAGIIRLMASEEHIREAIAEFDWCTEVLWGSKLSAVAVTVADAEEDVVADLLTDAWRRRAPKSLVARFDGT